MTEATQRFRVRYPVGLPAAEPVSGRRATDELLWLQEFAERPLDTVDEMTRAQMGVLQISWARAGVRPADFPDGGAFQPDSNVLREIQGELRQLFERLRDGGDGVVWLPEASMRFGVRVHGRGRYLVSNSTASPVGPFFAAVAELLARIPGALRECDAEGCSRLYAPHRPQQRYCSKQCQNRSTMARYLKNQKGSAADLRRQRRHAAVKKRLGAKTKVGRGK